MLGAKIAVLWPMPLILALDYCGKYHHGGWRVWLRLADALVIVALYVFAWRRCE